MKNTTTRLLLVFMAAIFVMGAFAGCSQKTEINANTWLLGQQSMMDDIVALSENMDAVYSLYIIGEKSEEDFIYDIEILRRQHAAIQKIYSLFKEKYFMKPGTMTYSTKKGIEAVEEARELAGKVLESTIRNGRPISREETLYLYIAYQEKLKNNIVDYYAAMAVLNDIIQSQQSENTPAPAGE